jgi:hypothetical protein
MPQPSIHRPNRQPASAPKWYTPLRKKTPPLAAKQNGGAGTEKRPTHLIIPSFADMSIPLIENRKNPKMAWSAIKDGV